MDPSIKRIIEQKLSLNGVSEQIYLAFYELAIKEAHRKNPNANDGWLRWLIALMVWDRFSMYFASFLTFLLGGFSY